MELPSAPVYLALGIAAVRRKERLRVKLWTARIYNSLTPFLFIALLLHLVGGPVQGISETF